MNGLVLLLVLLIFLSYILMSVPDLRVMRLEGMASNCGAKQINNALHTQTGDMQRLGI